jgi:hypothetical protein
LYYIVAVEVWLEYALFVMGLPAAEDQDPKEMIRDVLERALTAAGLHVSKGALLWAAYREYEIAVFAGLQVRLIGLYLSPPCKASDITSNQQLSIQLNLCTRYPLLLGGQRQCGFNACPTLDMTGVGNRTLDLAF